jgi:hypothetical protein
MVTYASVRLVNYYRPTVSCPETGFEDISGDVREPDLWPAWLSWFNFRIAGRPECRRNFPEEVGPRASYRLPIALDMFELQISHI